MSLCYAVIVILLVTNASFTSVMHVYDDCSAVHALISGGGGRSSASTWGHFRVTASVWNLRWRNSGYACTVSFGLLLLALSVRDPRQVSLLMARKEITDWVELREQRFYVVKPESKCCSEHYHQYKEKAESELIHAKLEQKADLWLLDAGKTRSFVLCSQQRSVWCALHTTANHCTKCPKPGAVRNV
jgi:hypothetical protein